MEKALLLLAVAFCAGGALIPDAAAGASFVPVAGFKVPPADPMSSMASDGAGNFWGTTTGGGAYGYGTIFKVNAAAGIVTDVIDFTGTGGSNRGNSAYGGLVSDGSGNFWGTTEFGGMNQSGTVFKVNAATGILTTLVDLTNSGGGGIRPLGTLVSDGSGNFWGTTVNGGAVGNGTIFKVKAATGILTTVLSFTGTSGSDLGSSPCSGLVSDGTGNLWGTTATGGTSSNGTIYKVNVATGGLTTVYSFPGMPGYQGTVPLGGLVSDGAGNLWGTTSASGASYPNNYGAVFKVNVSTGNVTIIVGLTGTSGTARGEVPYATLAPDGNGYLWGTAPYGGFSNNGTIFAVSASTGQCSTFCDFTGVSGSAPGINPYGGLVSDGAGNLWGTTSSSVFKINATTGLLTNITTFANNSIAGIGPRAGLVSDGAGNYWGTTYSDATNSEGTLFKLNAATGALTTVVAFTGTNGANPSAALVSDGAGNLWGSTYYGGANGDGTVYKINASTNNLTTLVSFTGLSGVYRGAYPGAALASDGAGNLWGTTGYGGANDWGTVFKINVGTGNLTTVLDLPGSAGEEPPPPNALVSDGDGNFWGTLPYGATDLYGSVIEINEATGNLTTLINFTGTSGTAPGINPYGELASDGAGNFWGTTSSGGIASGNNPAGDGTIFKVDEATGALTTVFDFPTTTGTGLGATPHAALVSDGAGNLWGTTEYGGASNDGTVFKVNAATVVLTTVFDFTGSTGAAPGANPVAVLVSDGAGNLWGTASTGGVTAAGSPAGGGEIFRINTGPATGGATASGITATSAILSGTVNPNAADTTASFQIGTTGTYGTIVASQDIGSGTSGVMVTGTATGLVPGTTYHYQLVTSNTNGQVATADQTFTTMTSYNYWDTLWFGSSTSSHAGDTVVNNDAGIHNLLCYALGLNPFAAGANSLPASGTARVSGSTYLTYNFTRNTQATDVTYIVEASDNLANPSAWTAINTFSAGVWSPSSNVTETGSSADVSVKVQDTQPIGAVPARALRLEITH